MSITKVHLSTLDTTGASDGDVIKVTDGNVAFSTAGGGVTVYDTIDNLPTTGNSTGDQAFVSGSNRLYIWNGSGWYNIALINTDPSFTTGPESTYALATDQSVTTISLLATDPEGLTVAYSAVPDADFSNLATISQSANVFTITPADESNANTTSGTVTFRASDGINLATSISTFTLTFRIENTNFTSALIKASGNNGTNTSINDASSSNHTITVNGDATAQAFTPHHPGGYSAYFDGTGDYLSIPTDTSLELGSSNYTIECWFYLTASSVASDGLISMGQSGSTSTFASLQFDSSRKINWFISQYSAVSPVVQSPVIQMNTWYHVAVTRNGNDHAMYLNGISVDTQTTSYTNTIGNVFYIGCGWYATNRTFYGYIADARLVKGTAVYTSDFTPPTKSLTTITNTSLLTCHLPYIADGSTSNHTITLNGNVSTQRFGPYDYIPYSVSEHGASVYLDGTGDKLTIPADTQLAADNGNFTFETWIYPTAFTSYDMIASMGTQGTNHNFTLFVHNSSHHLMFEPGTGSWGSTTYTSSSADGVVKLNQWQHIALVYDSGNLTIYRNGKIALYQGSASTPTGHTGTFALGGYMNTGSYLFTGYIAGTRIVQSAVYTNNTAFIPPTAPLSAITNTGMLLQSSPDVYDASGSSNLTLYGDTKSSTAQTKYASSSMYFDGSGDYINLSVDDGFAFGTGDFTIECWAYFTSISDGNLQIIFHTGGTTSSLHFHVDANQLSTGTSNTYKVNESTTFTTNTWYHVAVTRSNGVSYVFRDGVLLGTGTADTTNYTSTGTPRIGANSSGAQLVNGYIEDLRITKGLARYPFIPTQKTLTAVSNTELLAAHASTLIDGSGNSATLTAAGNAAVSTFGPYSGMNSIYFDGSGDYVTSSRSSSDMGIGTGDFTIECWFYDDGSANDRGIWESRATGSSTGMTLTRVDGNTIRVWTTSQQLVTVDVTLTNTWNHLAVVRNSGTLELFLNGQSQGTVFNSTTFADTVDFVIGGGRYAGGGVDRTIKGYISNFRIVKSAVYSNSFTPPTAELEG